MAYVDRLLVMPPHLRRYVEAARAAGPFIPPKPAVPADFAVLSRNSSFPCGERARFSVDVLTRLVCDESGFKPGHLASIRVNRDLAKARHLAMWLCHEHTGLSFPQIARRFGDRDHTSVIHAVRRVSFVIGELEININSDPHIMARRLWHVAWPRYVKQARRA